MSSKENRPSPFTNTAPLEPEVDPQLSACAQEGRIADGLPHPSTPEHHRRATRPARAELAAATPRLAAGTLVGGRYRIERELGEGGMGIVYLASDEQVPGERFAIKMLKEELRPESLALLREEVRKTRKLSHPNIVDVHSVNVDGQRLYVLMEYLEGKPLDLLLDEEFGRGMRFSRAWPIIEDVGAALRIAHDHNVIHSDLKPANVFLTHSGRTKLLDFGIARVSRGPLLHAASGTRALTPGYASCDMLQGHEADRRDDIYSFACVIYEILSGERPFGDLTALEARTAGAAMPPLPGLSRTQNAALARALSFEREARTTSVEALLAGLAGDSPRRAWPVARTGAAILVAIAAATVSYLAVDRARGSRHAPVVAPDASRAEHGTAPATTPLAAVAATPAPESIAVLPFVNMSGDPQQEYFSDGLAEELIDHLVHSTDLKVIARTSSFQFKGKNEDVRSIARQLAVTHLLEGSVRKDGRQMRITAQLIRASDGAYLWSHTYDHPLAQIFKVQDEIAEQVSLALRATLPSGYRPGYQQHDVRAYNLVMEGNYFKARRTRRDVERAAQLYQQAIDINPDYALAWSRLASAFLTEELLEGLPSDEQNRRILDALDRALKLDPNLVWAYYTRGGFEMNVKWNWVDARADVERMRQIDPRFAMLTRALGDIAFTFGDVERAVTLYGEDLERNPLDPETLDRLGSALCAANQRQQCLDTRLRLLQLHPEYGGIYRSIGLARLSMGQLAEALDAVQKEARENYRLAGLAMVYSALGKRMESDTALHELIEKYAASDAYGIAQVLAYRGQRAEALRWLDRAYRDHNFDMFGLKAEPLLRPLHGDPRFQALLTRMKLVGAQPSVDGDIRT